MTRLSRLTLCPAPASAATPLMVTRNASSRSAADVFPASACTLFINFSATSTLTKRASLSAGSGFFFPLGVPSDAAVDEEETIVCNHAADAIAVRIVVKGTKDPPRPEGRGLPGLKRRIRTVRRLRP